MTCLKSPPKSESQWPKLSKRPNESPSLKTLKWVRVAQQTYYRAHKAIFEQGSYDLNLVFWQMARDTNLLNTKIHEVQEVWTSQRGLKAANHATKASPKDI